MDGSLNARATLDSQHFCLHHLSLASFFQPSLSFGTTPCPQINPILSSILIAIRDGDSIDFHDGVMMKVHLSILSHNEGPDNAR